VDRKAGDQDARDVTVPVQGTDGREVKRTVWITQKLKVLMDYYYDSVPDVTYGTGKFLYNGRRLKAGQTPAELKMEDEDEIVIDFFFDMMGGGCGWAAAAAAEQTPVPA
jgi:small ubiquitin-related modifier